MDLLGFISPGGHGAADRLLAGLADRLQAEGTRLAGAVQVNVGSGDDRHPHMELHVLDGQQVIRISQNLGRGSRGCRLDPEGLERTVGLVEARLTPATDLLIVNKFGKQEIDGRGFRPLIGEALGTGIPVLTAVNRGNRAAFLDFAGGLARALPAEPEPVLAWVRQVLARSDATA